MKTVLNFFAILGALCGFNDNSYCVAQDFHDPSERFRLITASLKFLASQQVRVDQVPLHWKGEFPSVIENRKMIIALGEKGKRGADSNCFTAALIHNELFQNRKELSSHSEFASLLDLSYENILTFQNGSSFNFWHLLPMNKKDIARDPEKFTAKLVAQPNQYELRNRFARVRSDIANDADDTALAILASLHQAEAANEIPEIKASVVDLSQAINRLSLFRDDQKRNHRYPTNILHGNFKHTGAFLTWLENEHTRFLFSVFRGWKANMHIPEGVNNLDCVVNANILGTLAESHRKDVPGYQEACSYIESAVMRGLEKSCGLYYPNPYSLHYAVGKAVQSGVECLKPSAELLIAKLRKEQKSDGSWDGGSFQEPIQSTLFATHALFNLSQSLALDSQIAKTVEPAMEFIYHSKRENPPSPDAETTANTISWPEGTFFSGGGFVRNLLAWKSESFSTALGLSIFLKYEHYLHHRSSEKLVP